MANVALGVEQRQGRGLDDASINQILLEAQREMRPAADGGIESTLVGSMSHVALSAAVRDPTHIRRSFIGKIVSEGPDGEGDSEGAQYWIKEMKESSPDGNPLELPAQFEEFQEILDRLWEALPAPVNTIARWIKALNLGEHNPDDPEAESHSLIFGASPLVHVFQLHSSDGTPRWYFDRGAASGTRFGVVRALVDGEDGRRVSVHAVQENDQGIFEFVGDVVPIKTWPKLKGRHYRPFVWPLQPPPDPVQPETNVLPVMLVDGQWRVMQYLRWSFPELPSFEWPISDCTPVLPIP